MLTTTTRLLTFTALGNVGPLALSVVEATIHETLFDTYRMELTAYSEDKIINLKQYIGQQALLRIAPVGQISRDFSGVIIAMQVEKTQ